MAKAGIAWFSIDYHSSAFARRAEQLDENWEEHPEWAFYKRKIVDWLKATWR